MAARERVVDVGDPVVQGVRHADPQAVEPEWSEDRVADVGAVVATSNRLHQERLHPVRGRAVIDHARARLPFSQIAARSAS